MQKKLAITVIVIMLALFALIYVLYHIIQENQDSYNQIVLSQQQYDSRVIPYRRGDIVDRNGTFLATTEKVYNLIIDAKQIMSDEEDYLEATVAALSSVFGYDAQTIRTLITSSPDNAYIRYARQLSYDQKEAFEQLQTDTNKGKPEEGFQGKNPGRLGLRMSTGGSTPTTPWPAVSWALQPATEDGGNGGIEQSYNDSLIGTNGREYGYLNDDSNWSG